MTYQIIAQSGQRATATSMAEAKRIARGMCVRNIGRTSNMMTSGTLLPARRLYWQEWTDGSIVGDVRGYTGDNPMVRIQVITVSVGDRVEAGYRDDHDTGTVDRITADGRAVVRWDSHVVTTAPLSSLSRL